MLLAALLNLSTLRANQPRMSRRGLLVLLKANTSLYQIIGCRVRSGCRTGCIVSKRNMFTCAGMQGLALPLLQSLPWNAAAQSGCPDTSLTIHTRAAHVQTGHAAAKSRVALSIYSSWHRPRLPVSALLLPTAVALACLFICDANNTFVLGDHLHHDLPPAPNSSLPLPPPWLA